MSEMSVTNLITFQSLNIQNFVGDIVKKTTARPVASETHKWGSENNIYNGIFLSFVRVASNFLGALAAGSPIGANLDDGREN
jgi:hypothetical protein